MIGVRLSHLEIHWNENFINDKVLSLQGGCKAAAGCSSGGRPLGLPVPNGRFGEAIYGLRLLRPKNGARNDKKHCHSDVES